MTAAHTKKLMKETTQRKSPLRHMQITWRRIVLSKFGPYWRHSAPLWPPWFCWLLLREWSAVFTNEGKLFMETKSYILLPQIRRADGDFAIGTCYLVAVAENDILVPYHYACIQITLVSAVRWLHANTRCSSIAKAMKLRLFCIKPSIWGSIADGWNLLAIDHYVSCDE